MNKLQKWILTNFVFAILVTTAAVVGMIELKNWVNRSEAMRAMGNLGQVVSDYKQKNGYVPSESYVEGLKKTFEERSRAGGLNYRARWISVDSSPDTILAYARENTHSLFFRPGAIVLRYDGRVEWMDKASFDKLIAGQQTPLELEMIPK
jgi:hypothetical protein